MSRPRLLLLDGPSPNVVQSLVGTIKMLRDRGLTILLVEQNIGVAGAVAGQAQVSMGGEIAHSAPALRNKYAEGRRRGLTIGGQGLMSTWRA